MFVAMAVDAGRVRRSPILGLLGGLLGGGHHHHHEPIHHHHHDHHGIQITKFTKKNFERSSVCGKKVTFVLT